MYSVHCCPCTFWLVNYNSLKYFLHCRYVQMSNCMLTLQCIHVSTCNIFTACTCVHAFIAMPNHNKNSCSSSNIILFSSCAKVSGLILIEKNL